MARRPRRNALAPLGQASNRLHLIDDRLKLLEKAGLSPARCAELVGKFVKQAETALETAMNPLVPTEPDYHARLRAGAQLLQLIGANPPKSSAQAPGPSQVAVMINMPDWAKPAPRVARAKVVDALPANPTE